MAATIANVEINPIGGPGGKWLYGDVSLANPYAVGGDVLTAASVGLKFFKAVFVADNDDGYLIDANISTDKLTCNFKAWVFGNTSGSAALPFESATNNLSAVTFGVLIRGI